MNLNQAVARLNATGQRSGDLLPYAARASAASSSSTRPPKTYASTSGNDRQDQRARETSGRLIYYLYGPGRNEAHTDPHIVAFSRGPQPVA